MIKSITSLLAFIVGLSTIYYISFWGSFNINVFQYLAPTDIVKGIAYPLRFGAIWGLLFVAYAAIIMLVVFFQKANQLSGEQKKKASDNKRNLLTGIPVLTLSFVLFVFFKDRLWAGAILSVMILFFFFNLKSFLESLFDMSYLPADKQEEGEIFREKLLIKSLRYFEFPLLTLFLSNAFISGQVEANAIKSGRVFDYVLLKDLPENTIKSNEAYLIFLGSAGEKHFFVDKNINEHFMLDKSVLPVLKSYHFEIGTTHPTDSRRPRTEFQRH